MRERSGEDREGPKEDRTPRGSGGLIRSVSKRKMGGLWRLRMDLDGNRS